jgi:hypothetical protein
MKDMYILYAPNSQLMHFWFDGLSFIHQYGFQAVVKDDPVSVFSSMGRRAVYEEDVT